MQERNFEKQVKQKMEELSFTPSEPVWKKVEEQIREKKARRRIFFWLPLLVLLVGGGIWFLNNQPLTRNSLVKTDQPNNKDVVNNSTDHELKNQTKEPEIKSVPFSIKNTNEQTIQTESRPKNLRVDKVIKANSFPRNRRTIAATVLPAKENTSKEKQQAIERSVPQKKQISDDEKITGNLPNDKSRADNAGHVINNKATSAANKTDSISKSEETEKHVDPADTIKTIVEKEIDKEQVASNKSDSASQEIASAKTKKNVSPKWKLAVTATIGRSGINNGLNLFGGGQKDYMLTLMDQTASSLPSGGFSNASRPPSTQQKSSAFSVGALIRRDITKRISFNAGLQYDFYSTKMLVGQSISRDTAVSQNKSVERFYANSGSNFSNYHNQFHFISLPVGIDFQLLQKLPLTFNLGLSVKQLVSTNALLYSSGSRVYYQDNDVFNKTYLFSQLGLSYTLSLKKKLSLQFGPELNYGFSKMIKGSDNHLFSFGLNTHFIFSGK